MSPRSRPRRSARGCRRRSAAPPASPRSGRPGAPDRPARSRPARTRDAHRVRSTCASPAHLQPSWNMEGNRRANDTYGFALAAHPGKSQGRPPTNTGSKPIEQDRPARPRLLPDAPVPDGRTVLTSPDVQDIEAVEGSQAASDPFIRDTNPCESMIEIVRYTQRNVKHWQRGDMRKRWTAAGMLEAERQFRRIIGYPKLPALAVAVERDIAHHTVTDTPAPDVTATAV